MNAIALEQQRRDRTAGIVTTIVVHALLLILFLFIGLTTWDPPLPEEMIEVDMLESGGGLDGGMNSPEAPGGGQPTPAVEESQPEEVATEEESVVTVPKPAVPKPNPKPKDPKPKPNSLFTPSNNPSENSAPNGGGGGPTNSNTPGGGGVGSFHGEGFEGRLDGRGTSRVPRFGNDNTEAGTVAVDIKVDANGKVIYAKAKLDRPTTTTSMQLHALAERYAKQFEFTARQSSTLDQVGYIVFNFTVK